MRQTKTIGILGLGSYSTTFYISKLNDLYHQQYGDYSTCPFKMLNANFNDINPFLPNQFEALKPIVSQYLRLLTELGADTLLIPNITLHETIDLISIPQKTSLAHPIHATAQFLKENKHMGVVLFGTNYTMHSGYVAKILGEYDIDSLIPNQTDCAKIEHIRKQIYAGEDTTLDWETLNNLVEKYSQMGRVIFACTELSVVSPKLTNNHFEDMAILQLKKAMKMASLY